MNEFKSILERHGLSPSDVVKAGFPKGTIWKYVYGDRWPKANRIFEFERVLGIPREEFFDAGVRRDQEGKRVPVSTGILGQVGAVSKTVFVADSR